MNAAEVKSARDFSDASVWRGSLAALVVGYFMVTMAMTVWAGAFLGPPDILRGLYGLAPGLQAAMQPAALAVGLCVMAVLVVIGYFVMATYKGDHTTYSAAMIIGARTAAIGFAVMLLFVLLITIGSIFQRGIGADTLSALAPIVALGVLVLAAGAITGLAARLVAGAPTVERASNEA